MWTPWTEQSALKPAQCLHLGYLHTQEHRPLNYTSLYTFSNVNLAVIASECRNITKDFKDCKIFSFQILVLLV